MNCRKSHLFVAMISLLLWGELPAADPLELAADPRAMWYENLPGVFQREDGRIALVGHNIAGRLDRTGSANNEQPWHSSAGLDEVGSELSIRRMLWVPEGSKIILRDEQRVIHDGQRRGFQYLRTVGVYPAGSVFAEFLFDGIRLFEIRSREKTNSGWDTNQQILGRTPKGYMQVDSCIDCHDDIGRHSFEIDGARDWYGTVRGLEKDGPIHWHPWVPPARVGQVVPRKLRPEVIRFVAKDN